MAVSHFEFQHGFRNVAARRFNGERTCGEEEPENEPFSEIFAFRSRDFSNSANSQVTLPEHHFGHAIYESRQSGKE